MVLVGASNLGQSSNFFCEAGMEIRNLTVPGWVASPENIASVCEKISSLICVEKPTFVMDLFGNSTFRYEQFDSSVALPYKSGGKYHLEGNFFC